MQFSSQLRPPSPAPASLLPLLLLLLLPLLLPLLLLPELLLAAPLELDALLLPLPLELLVVDGGGQPPLLEPEDPVDPLVELVVEEACDDDLPLEEVEEADEVVVLDELPHAPAATEAAARAPRNT